MNNQRLLYLLDKYLSQDLTPEEQQEFDTWYAAHTERAATPPKPDENLFRSIRAEIRKRKTVHTIKRFALPAAACLILAVGLYLFSRPKPAAQTAGTNKTASPANTSERDTTIFNTGAKEKQFLLADGSTIRLSPNSNLTYNIASYNNASRALYLKGKAYFSAAKSHNAPFIVYTQNISTTALGTAFTVTAYDSSKNISVVLHSGKVLIKNRNTDVYLQPGEAFNLNTSSNLARVDKQPANADELVAGKASHYLTGYENTFDRVPLGTVLNDLANGYHVVIKFHRKDIKDLSFSGVIERSDSLSWVLRRIALLHNMTFITSANHEYIMQKKNP